MRSLPFYALALVGAYVVVDRIWKFGYAAGATLATNWYNWKDQKEADQSK